MKKLTKIFSLVLVALFTLVIVACGGDKDPQNVTISFEASKTTLTKDETSNLTVTVTGSDNTKYSFIYDASIVKIENNVLSVIADVTENKTVTVVAYAEADASKTATKVFTIKAASEAPSIEITTQRNTITYGEQISLNVVVSGLENKAYGWVVSDTSLVKVDNNVLSVLKEVSVDTVVTIKAVSVENSSVYAEKTITVKAPSSLGSITVSASQDTIAEGEEVLLSAVVTGLADTSYTWTVSHENLVKVEGNVLKLIGTVKVDTNVTITCVANADESVTKSKTIIVKAPIIAGQVGELTNAVLGEIANGSITFSGTVTDYYTDFNNSFNNTVNQYDSLVMMSDGRWYGQWNVSGKTANLMVDNYRRGETDGLKDAYGNVGHALEKLYINLNNEVAAEIVKDYRSIPAVWEAQHLWNHLGNLTVTNFIYSPDDQLYTYKVDEKDVEGLYLMTYLSYCLTPMLEDTLAEISFKIVDGHIVSIIARTEVLYYGSDTQEEADAMSYTELILTPSYIGTTVVPEPARYDAPENAELLAQALQNMQALNNYKYSASDVTTYAPSGDGGDYEISASASSTGVTSKLAHRTNLISGVTSNAVHNYTSSVGTVGEVGLVTQDAILIANTGKYSYGLDDKLYHTEYYGYKQNNDGTYDEFEYDSSVAALKGTRKVTGSLADILPRFQFSANIFEFVGTKGSGDDITYTFKLRATEATREIAMQVSLHSYAEDAEQSTNNTFTIVVDKFGHVVSTTYSYNLSGVYFGNITTKYSDFGTTVIPEDTFDTYVPRAWRTSWSEYVCKYFQPSHTGNSYEENAQTVFEHVFGEEVVNLPSPQIFLEAFDDLVFGPFFDWRSKEVDGVTVYTDYVSINVQSSEFDENSVITNYEELMEELITALQEEGYVLDSANTDTSGGESGYGDRYVTLIKGNIQIVITNNRTKHLSIYFYHLGDWILK